MAETILNQYTEQLSTEISLEAGHQARVEKCHWSQTRKQGFYYSGYLALPTGEKT